MSLAQVPPYQLPLYHPSVPSLSVRHLHDITNQGITNFRLWTRAFQLTPLLQKSRQAEQMQMLHYPMGQH